MHQTTPRIIKSNEDFVVIKLLSGEQLLAIRTIEDDKEISVEFPFLLKNYPRITKEGTIIEQVTAGPFCSFAEDRNFTFLKKDILICKRLHTFAIPFYMSLYNQHERMVSMGSYEQFANNFMSPEEMESLDKENLNFDSEREISNEELEDFRDIYESLKNKSKKNIH